MRDFVLASTNSIGIFYGMTDFTSSELAIFTATVAFLGTVVGALSVVCVAQIQAKSRERTEAKKLMITMALENWKVGVERGYETQPIENFMIHMAKVFDLFVGQELDSKKMEKQLKELWKTVEILNQDKTR
mgnify:CR=1 FL=1